MTSKRDRERERETERSDEICVTTIIIIIIIIIIQKSHNSITCIACKLCACAEYTKGEGLNGGVVTDVHKQIASWRAV